jgi:hypothetical protein
VKSTIASKSSSEYSSRSTVAPLRAAAHRPRCGGGACGRRSSRRENVDGIRARAQVRRTVYPPVRVCACAIAYKHVVVAGWLRDESLTCAVAPRRVSTAAELRTVRECRASPRTTHARTHTHRARTHAHTRTHRATPRTGHLHEQVGARCVRTEGLGSRRRDGGRHFFPFPYAARTLHTRARARTHTVPHHTRRVHTHARTRWWRSRGTACALHWRCHCVRHAAGSVGRVKHGRVHRETMGLYEELARVHAPSSPLNTPLKGCSEQHGKRAGMDAHSGLSQRDAPAS